MRHIKNKIRIKQFGFSTIEIALVLIISGLMFSMALNVYQNYKFNQGYHETVDHMQTLQSSLKEYLWSSYNYPCPADPTLPPNHPDYGMSVLCGAGNLSGDCSVERPRLANAIGNPISNVICAQSTVDRDLDGNLDMVLIGAFPFRTFQDQAAGGAISDFYREKYTYDGYDMRFTYAVSENMAAPPSFSTPLMVSPHYGAITIVDENNNSVTEPPDSAHYVLVSHGKNKRGAYTDSGSRVQNCIVVGAPVGVDDITNGPLAAAGLDLEIENCDHNLAPNPTDNDSAFRKAIRGDNENSPNFFDDVVFYKSNFETSLWQLAGSSGSQRRYLYNTNIGNVGIGDGLTTPASKLHVSGDVRVAKKIEAQEGFCDPTVPRSGLVPPGMTTPPECMQVEFVAGNTTQCADNEVAVAIDRNNLVCEPLFNSGSPSYSAPCGLDASDIDGDGNTVEQTYATGMTYNRSTNTLTPICSP